MKKAIITVGISGSGKTTWAEQFCEENHFININRDDIRRKLFKFQFWSEYKFTRNNEEMVTTRQRIEIIDAFEDENVDGVVISDTNLNETHRNSLIKYLETIGFDVELRWFDIDFHVAVKRDLNRNYSVGRDVIYRQWKQYLESKGHKKHDNRKKSGVDKVFTQAVIVDIDGTLAFMHNRSPYEWEKVGQDKPNTFLINLLEHLYMNHTIIVVSGRDSCCRSLTEDWLMEHGVLYDMLLMREADDKRSDVIVKKELFDNHIDNDYNVVAVFDDRPRVVTETWLPLGLQTYTVGDFNTDF